MTSSAEQSESIVLAEDPHGRGWLRLFKLTGLIAAIVGLFIAVRATGVVDDPAQIRHLVEDMGAWAPLIFIVIYIAVTVSGVPAWPLTVLAGVLFHWLPALIYVSISATVGASISFLIARYVTRRSAAAWMARHRPLQRLNELTAQHGAWVVAITRLVPIFPYNVLNYAFGLTAVRFWTYVFWSWLCMIPANGVYVLAGAAGTEFLAHRQVPWPLLGMIVAAAIFLGVMTWYGRRQWKAIAARRRERKARFADSDES